MSLDSHEFAEGVEPENHLSALDHRVAEGFADVGIHEDSEVDLTGAKKVDETHIKNLYSDVLGEMEKENGFTVEMPSISFQGYREVKDMKSLEQFHELRDGVLDTDKYELVLPHLEKAVNNVNIGRQKVERNLDSLFKFRFGQLTEESMDKLSEIYGSGANVSDVRTSSLDGATAGYKDRHHTRVHQQVIEFDYSILNFLDLETGEIREQPKVPPGKTEDEMRYRGKVPDDISDHEVAHAIHFQTNPHVIEFSDYIGADVAGEEDSEYKKDVRRGSIEAISIFEQELNHDEQGGLDSDFSDPFLIGDFLSMNVSPSEDLLYDNPYNLGKVAAFTVDAALREEHGEEQGRELAREYLMNAVTSPKGLEGAVENSLEIMGLPNFHENLKNYHDRISMVEDPAEELSQIGQEVCAKFGEKSLEYDEAIEAHYRLEAAEAAYREVDSAKIPQEYYTKLEDVKDNISSQRFGS